MNPMEIDALVAVARLAAREAYCPYSRFPVGAALRDDVGGIHRGCNIENASFGLTLCAERAALARAIGEGHRNFTALALVGGQSGRPAVPCGACLQALAEFCDGSLPIYLATPTGEGTADSVDKQRLDDFLPRVFRLEPTHSPGFSEPERTSNIEH